MYFKNLLKSNFGRRFILVAFDVICFALVGFFYYLIANRAGYSMPVDNLSVFMTNTLIQFALIFGCRYIFRVYKNVWRYSSTQAYLELVLTDTFAGIMALFVIRLCGTYNGLWQTVVIGSMTALLTLMSRFVYSIMYKHSSAPANKNKNRIPIAIVGAGHLGTYLAGDLQSNQNSKYNPLFFIDYDATKVSNRVSGLKVYSEDVAGGLIKKLGIQEVIIAISHQDSDKTARLYHHYRDLGCKVKAYDSLLNQVGNAVQKGEIRDFTIEDLLFRKPLDVSNQTAMEYYNGKTILVTGGGGSIGSELCRQIAQCKPKKLIIFEIYENNAYEIQQELLRNYGDTLDLAVEIGSIRDRKRLESVFSNYRPDVVFHAAAHKHVPLMEHSACEAIKNNVMGTYNTADMAEKYGVQKFILISTDKAVNPTNIMGASKRVCEMIIQCRTDSKTNFAAVRFGNVLGSNGSVIPLFKKQIAAGQPVTITDKRIIRYFMTIPEASQLVMHTGAMADKGELFVLDMGKPIKIYDLAVNMIKLSGLEPEKDIKIEEIGLRPGEKLYEELLMKTETLDRTENNMIFIERDTPYTREQVDQKISILNEAVEKTCCDNGSSDNGFIHIKKAVAQVVPTYHDPDEVNQSAEHADEMKLAGATV